MGDQGHSDPLLPDGDGDGDGDDDRDGGGTAQTRATGDRDLLERSLELITDEFQKQYEDLRLGLVASGTGTFTITAATGEARWEGYPHPLTGRAGRCVGDLDGLLGRVRPSERGRIRRALDAAFAVRGEVNVDITVGDRCVILRGGVRDDGGFITGICLDITKQQTEESARRRRADEHRRVLYRMTRAVSEAGEDIAGAIRVIAEAAASTLNVEVVGVWSMELERGMATSLDFYEALARRHTSGHTIAQQHLIRYVEALEGARILAAGDALADPRLSELVEVYLKPRGVTSMLDAPVRVAGRLRAFVSFEHVGPPREWSPEEEAFAASTADLVALVMESRDRRGAEMALERQRAFLRQVIDLNPNLIFAKDREGRFTLVNRAVADLYGTTVDELVGKTDADFNADPAQVRWFRDKDCLVMDSLRDCVIPEEKISDWQGHGLILSTIKRPIVDASGRADQVLGVSIDITQRKRAEEERRKLELSLRQAQKMESVGLLAGGLAHDFNNLLTPILAYSEHASRALGDDHELNEDLLEIVHAARQARDITAQLMAFGRKQMLKVKPLDLNDAVKQMRRMLSRLIPENITIAADLAPDLPPVLADPTQIGQIIINLAANARDAMLDGGTLTLATRQEGGRVRLSIGDTGSGIAPDILPHIFEPFFTTKEMGRGTGLGLATVYGIVTQHGGTIDVDSAVGRGTTFTIDLPRTTEDAEALARAVVAPARSRGQETILVAEDDAQVRRLVMRMLTVAGFSVLAAGDPRTALHIAESHPGEIHLLLTDVIMPNMNGKDLYDRVAAGRPAIKVVFMSGHAQDVLGQQGMVSDGTTFVAKPFSPAELTRAVRETLDGPPGVPQRTEG